MIVSEELQKINDKEKALIVTQPGEPNSPWETVEGKNYHRAHEGDILQGAINFYQQIVSTTESGFTHAVFGNYQYSKGSGYIFRSEYKQKKTNSFTTQRKYTPRYLEEVFLGTWEEINYKLQEDPSKDWSFTYSPIIVDGKVMIVRNKT